MKWKAKAAAIAGTVVLGGLLSVRVAAAETITVNSGLLEWSADPGSRVTFTLGSDQVTSNGSVGRGDFNGTTLKFDGDDDGDDLLKLVMGGKTSEQLVNGNLMFDYAPLFLPANTDVTHGMATISEPFTLTGSLSGLGIGNSSSAEDFVGSGVVFASFNVNNPNVVHLRFEFGPSSGNGSAGSGSGDQGAPSPTPEPATLLLLGSGIAGLLVVRRRRSARA